MGYTTDFTGQFTVDPPLTPAQVAYLKAFAHKRRMKRNGFVTAQRSDPLREAVGLPVGVEGEYFTGAAELFGQEHTADIVNWNAPPRTQPGLWCKWGPTDDGAAIQWNGAEKFYDYVKWLEYLVEHFLRPWGRSLSGHVDWVGEDRDDFGTIWVKNNRIQAVPGHRTVDRPKWF